MKSFRIVDTRFRILKGGKVSLAASIALVGGMLSIGSVSAHADTTTILASGDTSTPLVQDMGYSSGASTVSFDIQTQNIDALGLTTSFWTTDPNPDGLGGYDGISDNPLYATDTLDNTITLRAGRNITGRTVDDTLLAIYSQDYWSGGHADGQGGTDTTYTDTDLSQGTLEVMGNNTINGIVGMNVDDSGFIDEYDALGTINLRGYNVTFGDDVHAANTNIYSGTNNTINNDYTFYGSLDSNLNFHQAASVLLNGGLTGDLNYNGYNSIVTVGQSQTIEGDVTTSGVNGVLVFQGAGEVQGAVGDASSSLKEVRANGIGNVLFTDNTSTAYVDHVNYQAAATIGFDGGLNLTVDDSTDAVNTVTFNNHDGVLQINNGDLTGIEEQAVVTTTSNNKGTVTMVSGTQEIFGNIGSAGHAIKTLNIGGENTGGLDTSVNNYSETTANGDIYATSTVLNNNSTTNNSSLIMATDYDLYSTVTTTDNGAGVLTLAGGIQNVTGDVGSNGMRLDQVNSGATGATSNFGTSETPTDVYADTVSNTGTGTTNFSRNVTATTINVDNGTSNFTNNVTAVTTNIGTGEGNFNKNNTTGVTDTNIVFTGAGTANLYNGLTNGAIGDGTIAFASHDATVNVWDGETIAGAITTLTDSNTGTVNYRGDGAITSTVGATGMGIKELNINTNNEQNTQAGVTANGDIYAGIIHLQNNATLTLADNTDITGTTTSETNVIPLTGSTQVIAAALNGSTNTGTVRILGTSNITGVVGANDASIATIEAGATNELVTFNNMVYAKNLNYTGNGTVVLNGQTGVDAATAGMKGTIDFGTNGTSTGTLQIGDNVNLTTGANGIQFVDANSATMIFNGSSTVTGVVGGDTGTHSTFAEIYAGEDGKTVTFTDNVHVMEGALNPETFYVSGTGTVNFQGNLYGDLVYNADGVVNVSHTKSILVDTLPLAVSTSTAHEGTLNYLGNTTLDTDIGESGTNLLAVNFNTETNNVTQTINKNIYADTTTIGHTNEIGDTATHLVNVTGQYDYAGATSMYEWAGQTAAIISNVTGHDHIDFGGDLTIADTKSAINFGKSHVNVAGDLTTNDGAMSFTVNTLDVTGADDAISSSAGSALVTVAGTLNMSGAEKIHVNYVGSLANAGSYTLVTAGTSSGVYEENEAGLVSDNSFSIDTTVTLENNDLVASADRTGGSEYTANALYTEKSQTQGDLSNNASKVLAGIAATGNQTGDMIEVIQKMEIDSFGYGDTQQNLATQVKRLAPIANASLSQSAIGANTLTINTVSNRIADLRGDSVILPSAGKTGISSGDESIQNGAWVKVIASTATQQKDGMYDGYKTRSGGLALGIDRKFGNDITAGLAFGYTRTNIDQQDFRSGDSADTDSYNVVAYASKDFEHAYVEGALSYAHHNTENSRATAVGRTAQADIDANQYTGHLSAGYRFNIQDHATITPFLALDYTHLTQDAYTETGAGAINLSVDEMSTNRTTVGGGLRIGTYIENGSATLRPEVKFAAYHISGGSDTDITAQYVGGGEKFVTPGNDLNNMMYNVGLGLKAQMNDTTSLGFTIDYDRSSNGLFQGYTGQLVGRYEF